MVESGEDILEINVAAAKTAKYGLSECGDTFEVVERPKGGLTCILADGQGSGRPAKRISKLVVNKAVSLISDGARDGAVARAVHDFLFALRDGKVSSTLTIVSVDLRTRTIVVSRNSNCPVLVRQGGRVQILNDPVEPIGVHEIMKPAIAELPLEAGTIVATFTDGILTAGLRERRPLEMQSVEDVLSAASPEQVDQVAERLLGLALERDGGRPGDDMTVMTIGVSSRDTGENVRRLSLSFPL